MDEAIVINLDIQVNNVFSSDVHGNMRSLGLPDHVIKDIISHEFCLSSDLDKMRWNATTDGSFSIKFAWHCFKRVCDKSYS